MQFDCNTVFMSSNMNCQSGDETSLIYYGCKKDGIYLNLTTSVLDRRHLLIILDFLQNGKAVVAVDANGDTESPANSSVAITLQTPASRDSVDKAIQVTLKA